MWLFDGYNWPGWLDWLGFVIASVGFGIAVWQVRASRIATTKATAATSKATAALASAQKHLTQRALMSVSPQLQSIVSDLDFSLTTNSGDVAQRALVRFGLVAREASELTKSLSEDESLLQKKLLAAADRAVQIKSKIVITENPDIVKIATSITREITSLSQDMAELAARVRNTLEGEAHV